MFVNLIQDTYIDKGVEIIFKCLQFKRAATVWKNTAII